MELNEIKKLLYKNKPIATRYSNNTVCSLYDCVVDNLQIHFNVPFSDGDFGDTEHAQLLIRWFSGVNKL